jgi:phosphoglycolate phosphatase
MAQYQLNKFGWHSLFKAVLITEQKYDKALLIKPYLRNEKTYMIGDTGKDIQVGKKLDLITVGVANGFLSKESLAKYKPDYIFDSVIELTNLLYD